MDTLAPTTSLFIDCLDQLTSIQFSAEMGRNLQIGLAELLPDCQVALLELPHTRDFHKFNAPELKDLDLIDPVNDTPPDQALLKTIERFLPLTDTTPFASSGYTIIPIGKQGKLRAIAFVDNDSLPEATLVLLQGYCSIAANHYAILDLNERDSLTKLFNRKTFENRIIQALGNAPRDKSCNAFLAILDIDHFKRINDNFGHLYGDEILLLMANLMEENFKHSDLLFRYGGEEFVIVLKCQQTEEARTALERFRETVATHPFPRVGKVTVSMGFTELSNRELLTTILDKADAALYYAKENGRNQSHYYSELEEQGLIKPPAETPPGDNVELW